MVDGYDKHGQPAQLCSLDFYGDCYRALTTDGVMVVNLRGEANDMEGCINCMRCAFCGAVVVLDALDSLNKIAFGCKGIQAARLNVEYALQKAQSSCRSAICFS